MHRLSLRMHNQRIWYALPVRLDTRTGKRFGTVPRVSFLRELIVRDEHLNTLRPLPASPTFRCGGRQRSEPPALTGQLIERLTDCFLGSDRQGPTETFHAVGASVLTSVTLLTRMVAPIANWSVWFAALPVSLSSLRLHLIFDVGIVAPWCVRCVATLTALTSTHRQCWPSETIHLPNLRTRFFAVKIVEISVSVIAGIVPEVSTRPTDVHCIFDVVCCVQQERSENNPELVSPGHVGRPAVALTSHRVVAATPVG